MTSKSQRVAEVSTATQKFVITCFCSTNMWHIDNQQDPEWKPKRLRESSLLESVTKQQVREDTAEWENLKCAVVICGL